MFWQAGSAPKPNSGTFTSHFGSSLHGGLVTARIAATARLCRRKEIGFISSCTHARTCCQLQQVRYLSLLNLPNEERWCAQGCVANLGFDCTDIAFLLRQSLGMRTCVSSMVCLRWCDFSDIQGERSTIKKLYFTLHKLGTDHFAIIILTNSS